MQSNNPLITITTLRFQLISPELLQVSSKTSQD